MDIQINGIIRGVSDQHDPGYEGWSLEGGDLFFVSDSLLGPELTVEVIQPVGDLTVEWGVSYEASHGREVHTYSNRQVAEAAQKGYRILSDAKVVSRLVEEWA